MTLALDATYSLGGELSGVGVYSREMLYGLAAAHPEIRFRFCYRPHRFVKSFQERLPANARRHLLLEPLKPGGALFHGLNQRLPKVRLRRAVSTYHDLFALTGDYSTPEFRRRFSDLSKDAAARSDAIIAVSAFTASQVAGLLGFDPSRIFVVHHGVRPLALPALPRERIVLHVGAIQKRKNLARLVEAFERMQPEWRLVLAGSAGYGAREIMECIDASPARPRIKVTGYITDAELDRWYARAEVFAFPSLDEGFGMPVLEAMAAGVPVIASSQQAVAEVAGGAALLVDPLDVEQLSAALQRMAQDERLREHYKRMGRLRASDFTWSRAVFETWQIYQTLL